MTGLDEEPELHWRADQEAALRPCVSIKHTFQRTARECPDVVFLHVSVGARERGVRPLPRAAAAGEEGVTQGWGGAAGLRSAAGKRPCAGARWRLASAVRMCAGGNALCRITPDTAHELSCSNKWAQHGDAITPACVPAPLPPLRLTMTTRRSCVTSWASRYCRRCSFGATAPCFGSTRAHSTWTRWAAAMFVPATFS
jgi:hypothetical protein